MRTLPFSARRRRCKRKHMLSKADALDPSGAVAAALRRLSLCLITLAGAALVAVGSLMAVAHADIGSPRRMKSVHSAQYIPSLSDCKTAISRSFMKPEEIDEYERFLKSPDAQAIANGVVSSMEPSLDEHVYFGIMRIIASQLRRKLRSESKTDRYYRIGHQLDSVNVQQGLACFPALLDLAKTAKQHQEKARVEAEVEAEKADRDAMELQERQDQLAAEAAQKAEASRQKEAAESKKPINALASVYGRYMFLKRCQEAREGYLEIYVSDAEMARAKQAVQRLEEKLKPQLDPDTDTGSLWSTVAQRPVPWKINRNSCQYILRDLDAEYKAAVPGDDVIKKDF